MTTLITLLTIITLFTIVTFTNYTTATFAYGFTVKGFTFTKSYKNKIATVKEQLNTIVQATTYANRYTSLEKSLKTFIETKINYEELKKELKRVIDLENYKEEKSKKAHNRDVDKVQNTLRTYYVKNDVEINKIVDRHIAYYERFRTSQTYASEIFETYSLKREMNDLYEARENHKLMNYFRSL